MIYKDIFSKDKNKKDVTYFPKDVQFDKSGRLESTKGKQQ